MTSDGGVFQIWIWRADCTGSFWESCCWRNKCDACSGLLADRVTLEGYTGMWDLSSSGENLAEVSCVHAGRGDCSLPSAGHCANETVNYSFACPVPFPAFKGVNLSASTRKLSGQCLVLNVPFGAGGAVMVPGTCQTGIHPFSMPTSDGNAGQLHRLCWSSNVCFTNSSEFFQSLFPPFVQPSRACAILPGQWFPPGNGERSSVHANSFWSVSSLQILWQWRTNDLQCLAWMGNLSLQEHSSFPKRLHSVAWSNDAFPPRTLPGG